MPKVLWDAQRVRLRLQCKWHVQTISRSVKKCFVIVGLGGVHTVCLVLICVCVCVDLCRLMVLFCFGCDLCAVVSQFVVCALIELFGLFWLCFAVVCCWFGWFVLLWGFGMALNCGIWVAFCSRFLRLVLVARLLALVSHFASIGCSLVCSKVKVVLCLIFGFISVPLLIVVLCISSRVLRPLFAWLFNGCLLVLCCLCYTWML